MVQSDEQCRLRWRAISCFTVDACQRALFGVRMPARLSSVAIARGEQWPADLMASTIGVSARARSSAITVAWLRLL